MFSRALSGVICGTCGMLIHVEADVSEGLPVFDMVGFLSSQVREAKERVRTALKNSGFSLPAKRITINLSPANIRKEGTAFDLPIAASILCSLGVLPSDCLESTLFIGELSLNGTVHFVNGVLPLVHMAFEQNLKRCLVPYENAMEGAIVEGIQVIGIKTLKQMVEYLIGACDLKPCYMDAHNLLEEEEGNSFDFSDVAGQEVAKRAIEIAVSGFHNLLFLGPKGVGKSMLAKRIPTIMPELSFTESMELSKIYSIAGLLKGHPMIRKRPFRSPHHTITPSALVGGGRIPKPGEISLANKGVLFLDELPEYPKNVLELLRQPLEESSINLARVYGTFTYPADFMLVAAMNPCACGYYPDRNYCHCSETSVKKYLGKISRPFLDRIDICTEAVPLNFKDFEYKPSSESSEQIRERVKIAQEVQRKRYQKEAISFNSQLTPTMLLEYCHMGQEQKRLLEQIFNKMQLSVRGYHKILKVARTIADLDAKEIIEKKHLAEAISYRALDSKYWGAEHE